MLYKHLRLGTLVYPKVKLNDMQSSNSEKEQSILRSVNSGRFNNEFQAGFDSSEVPNQNNPNMKEVFVTVEEKESLLTTTIGIAAGYLVKKIFVGKSKNPGKLLIGNILMFGVTNLVARHPETVRAAADLTLGLIGRLFRLKSKSSENGADADKLHAVTKVKTL